MFFSLFHNFFLSKVCVFLSHESLNMSWELQFAPYKLEIDETATL